MLDTVLLGTVLGLLQSAPEPAVDAEVAVTAPAPESARPLGYLSDPDTPPEELLEALAGGKVIFNNRLRLELADTTGRDSSTAFTNRVRLGYETKPLHGFSAAIEMENVAAIIDDYFVPATGDGSPSRTVIADPVGTEVNRALVRYSTKELADQPFGLTVTAGRQRINLEDARFVGDVAWRQFSQTFDAASVDTDLGVDGLRLFYAYVWRVQRIFGPDGPNWDSDSHILHSAYTVMPELRIEAFAYLLDFESDSPANSLNTLGARITGSISIDGDDEESPTLAYEFTYAHQTDAGSNPIDQETDFIAAKLGATHPGLGTLFVGYQLMTSDGGNAAFRFPLGTNHKFQGFADQFLVTPATGLQDLFVGAKTTLPHDVVLTASAHQFWSEDGPTHLGWELDGGVGKKITPNWSVLAKGAYFNGTAGAPDTVRFWLQTTFSF